MNKDVKLLSEAYKKVVLEEHEHCKYAKEGCKCDECPECRANQETVTHEEDAESMVGSLRKLNSPKAIKAIINTARELLHRYDKHGEIAFMDEVKPFYVQNGKLLSGLLIVKKPKGASGPERSGFFPRISRTVEITNKVSAGGEPYARLLNVAVNKFLKGGEHKLNEDWHDRWAERHEGPGMLNLRGMSDVPDPAEAQWRASRKKAEEMEKREAELDKKEAYKKSLLRKEYDDDFELEKEFFEVLGDLKYNKPEVFDMFMNKLDDKDFITRIKNLKGVSL